METKADNVKSPSKPPTTKAETAARLFAVEQMVEALKRHAQNQHGKDQAMFEGLHKSMSFAGVLATTLIRKGILTEKDLEETVAEEKRRRAVEVGMQAAKKAEAAAPPQP